MKRVWQYSLIGGACLLSACGQGERAGEWQDVTVRPDQFAVLPCGAESARPCALVIAGGKRILFGAPAGIGLNLRREDLRQLDAVVVFSLRAADIEGLDEVRNASWKADRSDPLMVIGPPGLEQVVTALNHAFEQADALHVVENGSPAGGYDAALIFARSGRSGQIVFNTGDLIIASLGQGFEVTYGSDRTLVLQDCRDGAGAIVAADQREASLSIGCDEVVQDRVWPLTAPVFIE